jgi:hypothetical protein
MLLLILLYCLRHDIDPTRLHPKTYAVHINPFTPMLIRGKAFSLPAKVT